MDIVVSGGTGFIGRPLVAVLAQEHRVFVLTRESGSLQAGQAVLWHAEKDGPWQKVVAGADAVINLAGSDIAEGRWTEQRRRAIMESRVRATEALVSAMKNSGRRDQTLINASAIGYYGSRGDEVLSEASAPGSGFLSDVTRAWEASAASAANVARVVILRFGIVLAGDGGALPEMARPVSWCVGGPLGSGRQWLSWIDRGDLIRLVQWVIHNQRAAGVYNATSPNPVRNDDFTRTLASVLHRPALFRVPAFALRLVLGREKAEAMLLFSDRVVPRRAVDEGFEFLFSDLRVSLERAFGRSD